MEIEDCNLYLRPSCDPVAFWVCIVTILTMLVVSAVMAGMLMGYMSMDKLNMRILTMEGTTEEKQQAQKVLPIIHQGHSVLVSLLLVNAAALEALPILLNRIVSETYAIAIAATFVLFFGEILPSAIFTGKNQLAIAARLAPLCQVIIVLMCPIAYPVAKVLDFFIGEGNDMTQYKRNELKALIELQKSSVESPIDVMSREKTKAFLTSTTSPPTSAKLHNEEVTIIHGALDMSAKTVGQIITPFKNIFMLNAQAKLDSNLMVDILSSGYSRIPVYQGDQVNIIGLLLVKRLIVVGTNANKSVGDLMLRRPLVVPPNYSCYALLNQFRRGKSHFALVSRQSNYVNACWTARMAIDPKRVSFTGMATIEDVMEELIQEDIDDETDLLEYVSHGNYEYRRNRLRERGMKRASRVLRDLALQVRQRIQKNNAASTVNLVISSESTPLLESSDDRRSRVHEKTETSLNRQDTVF
jgi:metal transporter CNNM